MHENVHWVTSDGIRIEGWLIPNRQAIGTLIVLHGYGASKADLLDVAAALHQQGRCHLLMFDFRAHGFSGGKESTFGHKETSDVQGAIHFLKTDPRTAGLPLACLGVSMGGAIAILSAARMPAISAVVTDCAYAQLANIIARTQLINYHIPRIPLGQAAIWGMQFRLGTLLSHLSPVNVARQLAPRPLLIIHGQADVGIPVAQAHRLYKAAARPRELWVIPKAEHAGCFYQRKEEYPKRVMRFLEDAFTRTS